MTAINFPDSPSNGDTHQGYTYNSTKGTWTPAAAVTSFTGLSDTPSTLGTAGQIAKVNSGATALEFADQSGVTVYANVDALPGSGNTGDLAFVTATNRLYLWTGTGWYNIALINTNPTISGVSSSYSLAIDGTATVVTVTATDPEGLPITYSIASDTSGNIATVTQGTGASSNVFTITPSTNTANGGTFSLTFRASDGVNIASSIASFVLQFKVVNSNYTTALVTSVGANNAVNNTFVDSSTNNQTITVAGNITQGTFSPYRSGGYSTYFDGTGDYINTPTSSTLAFGSGDFTFESFVYVTNFTQSLYPTIISNWTGTWAANKWSVHVGHSSYGNKALFYCHNADSVNALLIGTTTLVINTWYHIAVVRNGNTFSLYVDGALEDSDSSFTGSIDGGSSEIAYCPSPVNDNDIQGYLSDTRLVKGTAVYTSNFTPPTERLTAITNTGLLTCHLPYIADGSTNSHTITVAGNTKTEPFAPYDYQEYSSSSHGGSIYNDGTGTNYLSVTSNDFQFGTSDDFVIEAWVYPTAAPSGAAQVFDNRGAANGLNLAFTGAFASYSEPLASQLTGTTKSLNQWYHVAVVRYNGTRRLFVNGVSEDSVADTGNYNSNSGIIASRHSLDSQAWNGNISDFRIIRGTIPAAYQGTSITVPTAPLAADSYTKLHLQSTNAGIIDKSQSRKFLTLSGDSKSSTTQSKYLSSSMYFDGSGDNILTDVMTTNGDFTVEMWIRFDGSVSNPASQSPTFFVWGTTTFMLYCTIANNTMQMIGNGSGLISGSTTISADTWYHVAFARQGNTGRLFVDGNLEGSTTSFTTDLNARAVIGSEENAGYPAKAYMSDVRITKGLARYTANFTPPTAELKG